MSFPDREADRGAVRAPETLPRRRRIQKRPAFQNIYARGRKLYGRLLVVFALSNAGSEVRLGITVTRKTGGAALRNRVRRRLREIFRRRVAADAAGWDLVVNLRAGAAAAPYAELEADFVALIARLGGRR